MTYSPLNGMASADVLMSAPRIPVVRVRWVTTLARREDLHTPHCFYRCPALLLPSCLTTVAHMPHYCMCHHAGTQRKTRPPPCAHYGVHVERIHGMDENGDIFKLATTSHNKQCAGKDGLPVLTPI